MAIDISGIYFFMPVFSFFFVFIVIYAILFKTKILGENKGVYILLSMILSIIFMSVSSLKLYIETILPWFVILVIIVFLVLVLAAFSTKEIDKIMTTKFAWFFIIVLIIIFLIAAIHVFNPILHSKYILASGEESNAGLVSQIEEFFLTSKYAGALLLIVVGIVVSWILVKSK